jgi:PIN domain nuclease of toxin-antitoxin system
MWEASIKSSLGRLDADLDELIRQLSAHQFLPLPIGMNHVALLSNLPNLHKDPFDRMLIAQAQAENLRLLSADRLLADYSPMVDLV